MRSGENPHKQGVNVPRRSRAQSDAAWRRRRKLDRLFSLSPRDVLSQRHRKIVVFFRCPRAAFLQGTTGRSWTKITGGQRARQRGREMERVRERERRCTAERERREEGKGASSGAARERTFVIAPRVTRCPRSVATPPDARQSSVRRATVVLKLTGFRIRLHFALVLRRIRVSSPSFLGTSPPSSFFPSDFPSCNLPFTTGRTTSSPKPTRRNAVSVRSFFLHSSRLAFLLSLRCVVSVPLCGSWPRVAHRERHSSHVDRAELSFSRPRSRNRSLPVNDTSRVIVLFSDVLYAIRWTSPFEQPILKIARRKGLDGVRRSKG